MARFVGISLLIAGAAAPANNWMPVAIGPDNDPTGLYIDKDSLKGIYPVKTIWEKFVNSYNEQKLSLVEMNCARNTWRTLTIISRSPNGSLLKSAKFPKAKSDPIVARSSQAIVRRVVCEIPKAKLTIISKKR